MRGEGIEGLTRGFMYARRVVVSLWNVNDKATASLMQRLYVGMLRGVARRGIACGPDRNAAQQAMAVALLLGAICDAR